MDVTKLGLQASELEPCMWKVRCSKTGRLIGLAMTHVGDFILAGDRDHEEWTNIAKQIRKLYK
eukprot:5985153-Pyramimonas_sp.AAC.1